MESGTKCCLLKLKLALSAFLLASALPAHARAVLQPVVAGLDTPVYVTNAHDGTNRLFIVEQPGRIKLLQPGASTPAVFLDLTPKVLSGGEQGLLGLAFHPQFPSNHRFFVDYTRQPDGATVVAEYKVSAANPNVAEISETVLLTIGQPYENHNGGMIEFGPDGFLYIGMGDGGAGNDPQNRAQNPQELLGKILRIDVDHKDPGKAYASPPGNPFLGTNRGREEIYALGLRNPWRFSFDRGSGRLYVGDVGQDAIEEVDIVTAGGNFGWRVFEGTRCTNLGPTPCTAGGFIPPIAEYHHDNGRCAIIGGYVYRGAQSALPFGSYVYGDLCSGEVFLLSGGIQSVLLNAGSQLSSFGEDESGEIYVVVIGDGTIRRIVNPDAPAKPTFYFPWLVSTSGGVPGQAEDTGFAVTNLSGSAADLAFTAYDRNGSFIGGGSLTNPSSQTLPGGDQIALVDSQLFGAGLPSADPAGWVKLESSVPEIAALFLGFNSGLTSLDGADITSITPGFVVFPDVEPQGLTQVHLANPNPDTASVTLRLVAGDGTVRASAGRSISGHGALSELASDLFPNIVQNASDYLQVASDQGVVSFEYLQRSGADARGLNGQDGTAGNTTIYASQYAAGGGYRSALSVVNLDPTPGKLTLRLFKDDGAQLGSAREILIAPNGKVFIDDPAYFLDSGGALIQGYIQISSEVRLAGSVALSDPDQKTFSTAIPLTSTLKETLVFGQVASNPTYFTGIAMVNPGAADADVRIEVFDSQGGLLASGHVTIKANGRSAGLLTEYFADLIGRQIGSGYIRVSSSTGLAAFALFGTNNLSALSAIPAQGR